MAKKHQSVQDLPPTAQYLVARYQDWWKTEYNQTGKEPTQSGFANFLGVDRISLNQWLNGSRVPDSAGKAKIAKKLGPGIYAVTGETNVDPELMRVIDNWATLPKERQSQILALFMGRDDQPEAAEA